MTNGTNCGKCGKLIVGDFKVWFEQHKCNGFKQYIYEQVTHGAVLIFLFYTMVMLKISQDWGWIACISGWLVVWIIMRISDKLIRRLFK